MTGRTREGIDVLGFFLGGGGLVAVVYGFGEAAESGWKAPVVLLLVAGGAVLLLAFAWQQTAAARPLLLMHIILDRNRGGSMAITGLAAVGMYGTFFFLTYYLQLVLGFSPLEAGAAFLPMMAATVLSSGVSAGFLHHTKLRKLMVMGLLIASVGIALLATLRADSVYLVRVLPPTLAIGFGLGFILAPLIATATLHVTRPELGATSSSLNASRQVGVSVGIALLNTVAATATARYAAAHQNSPLPPTRAGYEATTYGFATAFWWAAGAMLLAAAIAGFVMTTASERAEVSLSELASR